MRHSLSTSPTWVQAAYLYKGQLEEQGTSLRLLSVSEGSSSRIFLKSESSRVEICLYNNSLKSKNCKLHEIQVHRTIRKMISHLDVSISINKCV